MLLLQAIFLINASDYLTLPNTVHSFEFISIGIAMFLAVNFFIKNKEDTIRGHIDELKSLFALLFINTLEKLANLDLLGKIAHSSALIYNKSTGYLKYNKNLSANLIITFSLLLFITLYLVIRLSY